MGEELGPADPFVLLAEGVPEAQQEMGLHTLVVIGATFADGSPGFVLLNRRADPAMGDLASGEELQDHSCALADGDRAEGSSLPAAAERR